MKPQEIASVLMSEVVLEAFEKVANEEPGEAKVEVEAASMPGCTDFGAVLDLQINGEMFRVKITKA